MEKKNSSLHSMTFGQFAKQAIMVAVSVVAQGNDSQGSGQPKTRLVPASAQAEHALLDLHLEIVRWLRESESSVLDDADLAGLASRKLDEFLGMSFQDDVWYGSFPGGRPVVLAKEHVFEMHDESDVLKKIHLKEVLDAAGRGDHIPERVFEEYSSEISLAIAQRNLPVS